ncbi:MAG: methyltransferase domain-containing protein, partial [Desulfohalobiaceae bacterium]|nr:methyltransferase domain-containing protein [Desulfohalobiaceae bacterium]
MPLEVTINTATYALHRPGDLESLWEGMGQGDLGEDERIPYWVELWPAAIHLAEWIAENTGEVAGRRCLDLGCGLGLCACLASGAAARVVGMDQERGAVGYTRHNARLNKLPEPDTVQMDWRRPGFKPGSFSLVFAADIVYEKRFLEPVHTFLRQVLAPGGKVLLSTPRRQTNAELISWLRSRGWGCRSLSHRRIVHRSYDMEVTLWEMRLEY